MGKIGIISVIPKDFTHAFPTMEKSLREKGMSMYPGTFKMFYPFKEISGIRRTGLDPDAVYIKNLQGEAKQVEIERVTALRKKLEDATGLNLAPGSSYWNDIQPAKLRDGDNVFDLDNPQQAIVFAWLRVHPRIASSLEAYQRGEYLPETHFYIKDKDVEENLAYQKKKAVNDMIIKLDSMSPDKRKKVARLVGIPVDDNMKEVVVYNELDRFIKQEVVKEGPYKGQSSVNIFKSISTLDDTQLAVRDVVEKALASNIYREDKGGKITEGGFIRFGSKSEMIQFFLDEANQLDLLELEQRVQLKDINALKSAV
jgi:hypothetical protein